MHFLITGGAGFIGSHLVETLVAQGERVRVVDNFSTGKRENIAPFLPKIDFVEGDLRDAELCHQLCRDVDVVLHQAALGSVPRSIDDPQSTHANNVTASLNLLSAAQQAGVKRFVYASSSSIYGDTVELPKHEAMAYAPRSPYAASKVAVELYANVFGLVHGLECIGLRYFNVFGPRQDPQGAYAAVIPKFFASLLNGEAPQIYGDGQQSRDFTYVANVVQANLKAASAPAQACGRAYNVGLGQRISVNQLLTEICDIVGSTLAPDYLPPRAGDVRDSLASIVAAQENLGYAPEVDVATGLKLAADWYRASV